eukprot:jgi/Ulvmu1/8206/UM041_0015.1
MDVDEAELQDLYSWVDDIPLSRPKRNIARDFSDAVLVAEVVQYFFPRDVQLHNYSAANSFTQKMYNWNTLNAKVFHKLGFAVPKNLCEAAARAQPMAIEKVLKLLRVRFAELMQHVKPPEEEPHLVSYIQNLPARLRNPVRPGQVSVGQLRRELPNQPAEPLPDQSHSQADTLNDLREMNEILETKTRKLEQLVRLKDAKIQALRSQLQATGQLQ